MQDALKNLTRQISLQGLTCVLLAFTVNLGGCLSPVAIHRAVLTYDHTVSSVEGEILLLNIARARNHLPAHSGAMVHKKAAKYGPLRRVCSRFIPSPIGS
jgi:hypothetical protein